MKFPGFTMCIVNILSITVTIWFGCSITTKMLVPKWEISGLLYIF